MSDEPKQTYTAREIVLEFFPETHDKLVPSLDGYRLEQGPHNTRILRNLHTDERATLTPVAPAGNRTTQLCCDLCQQSTSRHFIQLYRAEIPGSQGRRFRYVMLCRNSRACEERRINDKPLRALIERLSI